MSNLENMCATTEVFGALIAMACDENPAFREKFTQDPHGALNQFLQRQSQPITIDSSIKIVVHENDADTLHVAAPSYYSLHDGSSLTDEQLEQIAAGEFVAAALASMIFGLGVPGLTIATAVAGSSIAGSLGSGALMGIGAAAIGTAVGLGALATAGVVTGAVVGGLAASGNL